MTPPVKSLGGYRLSEDVASVAAMTDMNAPEPPRDPDSAAAQDAAASSQQGTAENSQEMIGATPGSDAGRDDALQRDPQEWATGDEPMTEAQKSYLDTLAKEAGEQLPAILTKAEASEHIDRLQGKSNRVD